ncbi:hypothetical protein JCM11641_005433 [Rhodosporidiobolus odoratus]
MANPIVDLKQQPRSAFVAKLHELLSAENHPEYLRWLDNSTFAITSVDADARTALAPQWDFRSLSSFIRQLSYYAFKRLSDRRRSAERRSSMPAYIVFTHPSGNFVRDDYGKTANIHRKLRARKSSAKRKNSAASSTGTLCFEHEYPDRSPTPVEEVPYDPYEPVKTSEVQMGLQQYQLAPWNAGLAARSAPRTISAPPMQLHLPPHAEISPFDTTYPSPVSAPSSSAFFPSSYHPAVPNGHMAPPTPEEPVYYFASSSVPTNTSPFATYAPNELPPLRAVTSGLVAPPSPPPEQYIEQRFTSAHQPHPHVPEEERTPSPVLQHAQIAAPHPVVLPSVAQLDHRIFYPPSPDQCQATYYHPPNGLHLTGTGFEQPPHPQVFAKSAFFRLSGEGGVNYPASVLAASHA